MKLKSLTLILAAALTAQVAFAQQSKSDPSVEFNPHWFGQIQGGAGYTIGETAFKDLISPAGALSFGYQFNPTLGLRFGASGWQGKGNVVSPLEVYKFNYVQGNVDLVTRISSRAPALPTASTTEPPRLPRPILRSISISCGTRT